MSIRIDVYHHSVDYPSKDSKKLDAILSLLEVIQRKGVHMSVELDKLTLEVQETQDVQQSAITLMNGLSQQIADLKDDPVALQALADSLDASAANLAAAIVANTPPVV